ncbi:MAG: AgmX/PglI C-terminal domain-containing protein [candidate division KSB1 bacterium]|nr:AgmX/PglI C-terminal domain-containing protein [candidate division KSB1 bacterium]
MEQVGAGVFPKEFERRFIDSLDKRYTAILIVSLLIHLTMVSYFATHPPTTEVTDKEIAQIQKRFASLVLDRPKIEETVKFAETTDIGKAKAAREEKKAEPKPGKKSQPKRSGKGRRAATVEGRKAERATAAAGRRRSREQIQKAVSNQGILGLLTSTSKTASGSEVEDVLTSGKVGQNLDRALENISGLKRGEAGAGGPRKGRNIRAARETGGGGIDELVEGLGKSEVSGVSRSNNLVTDASGSLLEEADETVNRGGRDIDAVAAIVKSHNAAIQYCYQRELKRNPNLRGKVVVRFIIDASGKVVEVSIVSSTLRNRRVERCIVNRIKRWNFGAIEKSKGNTAFKQVYTFGY